MERDSAEKHTGQLPNKGLSSERWDELNDMHLRFVNQFLSFAFFNSSSAQAFAEEIVKLLDLFKTEDEKTFALSTVLYSSVVPYQQLPALRASLSDEAFNQILKAHKGKADLIRYIAKLDFTRGTDEATVVLGVLEEIEDKQLRIALLGLYLARIKNQIAELVMKRQFGIAG